jgi:transposase
MSTRSYSLDLRERVIRSIEGGFSREKAAKLFKIGTTTASRWWNRYKAEGHFNPRNRPGSKGKVDKSELIKMVENNPNSNLADIGNRFGVSASAVSQLLKKLGFSYKKNRLPTWKRMK